MNRPSIGILGGSGFYEFLKGASGITVETPYGFPSDKIKVSKVEGKNVAFLPRHGPNHEYPPHMIPYRANMHALKHLGVQRVIGPCAVGSLKGEMKPGDFVICDQFVNFTTGRKDTFFDGPETTHVSAADPYCPELRKIFLDAAKEIGVRFHQRGTVVVIQGPRFSSRAESRFFRSQGWEVINMTQYPEAILARELEMCYVNISLVTDYDVGVEGDPKMKAVSHEEVVRVFTENIGKLRSLILVALQNIPAKRSCSCGTALQNARVKA